MEAHKDDLERAPAVVWTKTIGAVAAFGVVLIAGVLALSMSTVEPQRDCDPRFPCRRCPNNGEDRCFETPEPCPYPPPTYAEIKQLYKEGRAPDQWRCDLPLDETVSRALWSLGANFAVFVGLFEYGQVCVHVLYRLLPRASLSCLMFSRAGMVFWGLCVYAWHVFGIRGVELGPRYWELTRSTEHSAHVFTCLLFVVVFVTYVRLIWVVVAEERRLESSKNDDGVSTKND